MQEAAAIAVFDQDNPNVEPASRRRKYKGPLRALSRNFRKTKPLPSLVFYPDGTHEEYMGARIERPRLREFLLVRCYGFHEAEAVAESR